MTTYSDEKLTVRQMQYVQVLPDGAGATMAEAGFGLKY